MKNKHDDLKVFITNRESACDECRADLGRGRWVFLAGEKGALCLSCADLDHLVFLPSGDAALTMRARKNSTLSAVVLKWSRARQRYERQGLLVEETALDKAEEECLDDAEVRERRRQRETEKRQQIDQEYVHQFAQRIRDLFPSCPKGREIGIAEHACLKYSGRVGRSAAAKEFNEDAVRFAVAAHIRHTMTDYHELLARGHDRHEARQAVESEVARSMTEWERRVRRDVGA
jgi:hypothetical protein